MEDLFGVICPTYLEVGANWKQNVPWSGYNLPEKEKTTVSGLRRLYVLKERCRALKWKIALEESLN